MSPCKQLEELMGALEKTRQELDTTKMHLSSTQQSLNDRDRHLNSLRQERRKQLEEILEMKLVSLTLSSNRYRVLTLGKRQLGLFWFGCSTDIYSGAHHRQTV